MIEFTLPRVLATFGEGRRYWQLVQDHDRIHLLHLGEVVGISEVVEEDAEFDYRYNSHSFQLYKIVGEHHVLILDYERPTRA